MTLRKFFFLKPAFAGLATLGAAAFAQSAMVGTDLVETRAALNQALRQGQAARGRAEKLEAEARRVTEQAEKTARQTAAVAARIQQTEAEIAAHEVRASIIERQREDLRNRLAQRQEPLVRLTAALQRLSRRPPVLALLRPGSVSDTMHMRALLDTMLPEVERRTAALRVEIRKGRDLRLRADTAAANLRESQLEFKNRRQQLIALESRQRLASREATGIASREADRALALSEKARDLSELVGEVGKQGQLRDELERLPGPVIRPVRPEQSEVVQVAGTEDKSPTLRTYVLPVTGRLVAGFGAQIEGRPPSRGIVLAARGGAQAISPAPGRVAFAGPYRGYGRIVIIEHDGGWTSLVTGLAKLDTRVGEMLVGGSPLGLTAPGNPIVTVELRRDGVPVNPLQFVRTL